MRVLMMLIAGVALGLGACTGDGTTDAQKSQSTDSVASRCVAGDGSPFTPLTVDGGDLVTCGAGAQCVPGPFCTPGGCIPDGGWGCMYGSSVGAGAPVDAGYADAPAEPTSDANIQGLPDSGYCSEKRGPVTASESSASGVFGCPGLCVMGFIMPPPTPGSDASFTGGNFVCVVGNGGLDLNGD